LAEESLTVTDDAGEVPLLVRALGVLALVADGRVGPAGEATAALAALAADHHRRPGDVALADTLRGHAHLLLGQPGPALRWLRQAAVVLREHDAGGFLGWCLAQQVVAAALLGDADLARAAAVEARAVGRDGGVRIFDGAAFRCTTPSASAPRCRPRPDWLGRRRRPAGGPVTGPETARAPTPSP
jgi:hypothetical protein